MRDKHDIRGRADWNSDGVTGYTQGANPRSNWVTDNMGKTILIILAVGVITIVSIVTAAINSGDDEPQTPAERQGQAGQ